jgi:hypothetical protein
MIVADGYMMGHLFYKVLLSISAFQHAGYAGSQHAQASPSLVSTAA